MQKSAGVRVPANWFDALLISVEAVSTDASLVSPQRVEMPALLATYCQSPRAPAPAI
jgi:hypothetical protein